MDNLRLMEFVKDNPVLYDVTHMHYTDNAIKMALWNQLGKEMNMNGESCRTRWTNIRDNYRRCLKRYSKRNDESRPYKYSQQLMFLRKYLETGLGKDTIKKQKLQRSLNNSEERNRDKNGENDKQDQDLFETFPECDLQGYRMPKRKQNHHNVLTIKKPELLVQPVVTNERPKDILTELLINKNENKNVDAIDAFLASLAPTLKSFSPYYLNVAKTEIFSTVQKYELKMLMEQYNESSDSDLFQPTLPFIKEQSTTPITPGEEL